MIDLKLLITEVNDRAELSNKTLLVRTLSCTSFSLWKDKELIDSVCWLSYTYITADQSDFRIMTNKVKTEKILVSYVQFDGVVLFGELK